jgi:hypothetical protein
MTRREGGGLKRSRNGAQEPRLRLGWSARGAEACGGPPPHGALMFRAPAGGSWVLHSASVTRYVSPLACE